MNEQNLLNIKKNHLLDWIYKQKNNIPVNDLIEFIKFSSKNPENIKTDQKSKNQSKLGI